MGFSIKKLVSVIVLVVYLFLTTISLVSFDHTHRHMDMGTIGCPYIIGGQGLCPNIFDHIGAWQQFTTLIFPVLVILFSIFAIGILFNFSKYFLLIFSRQRVLYFWLKYINALLCRNALNPRAP